MKTQTADWYAVKVVIGWLVTMTTAVMLVYILAGIGRVIHAIAKFINQFINKR